MMDRAATLQKIRQRSGLEFMEDDARPIVTHSMDLTATPTRICLLPDLGRLSTKVSFLPLRRSIISDDTRGHTSLEEGHLALHRKPQNKVHFAITRDIHDTTVGPGHLK